MKRLEKILEELKDITSNCRIDMHEPDEQEITAHILGNKLDNAMGATIIPSLIENNNHEIVVIIRDNKYNEHSIFSLADLIALARLAKL